MTLWVRPPFDGYPFFDRHWILFATELTADSWRIEASLPVYRQHTFRDDYMCIFGLDYFEEDFTQMAGDFLKKALESSAAPGGPLHFTDEELGKQFPALYDYLACAVGPNGKPREGACLIVYARDGEVTACLKDRSLKRAFYGRSDSLQDALRELESRLANP